jgi:transcriptional regulator GlxA family with amidase domain
MPPAQFVERMRLAEATRRLTDTDAPVERIAFSIGFRSADAFARAFRRQFRITPSDYRDRFSSGTPARLKSPDFSVSPP